MKLIAILDTIADVNAITDPVRRHHYIVKAIKDMDIVYTRNLLANVLGAEMIAEMKAGTDDTFTVKE